MLTNNLCELPANRAVVLDNVTCPYCGQELTEGISTKEHVIGRRFVPKGTLNRSWNLIVRACAKCNSDKSLLENDISAITLAGKRWFDTSSASDDEFEEIRRKVRNSTSQKTRKPVVDSQEAISFKVPFSPGATFSFDVVAPPQIAPKRLFDLARMQLMAFFYFITYDADAKRGGFWRHGFHPVSEAHHADWGNPLHRSFMMAVVNWEPRWLCSTAKGYFKSVIRRHPAAECWAWALEWNNNYRLIGFFGDRGAAQVTFDALEKPRFSKTHVREGSPIYIRSEVPLSEGDDLLFFWDD